MPALVVVPTAHQAARAARRLCDAGGGLLFGASVTTLEALVTRLLAAAGDRRAVLTPLGERLLAVEAGNEAGGPLAGLRPESGLAGALAATLSELRRGEVPAGAARVAAGSLAGAAAERLGAVARALEAFEARLARLELLDPAGAARAAAEAVRRGVPIDDGGELELLLLDGFSDPLARRVVAAGGAGRPGRPHPLPAAGLRRRARPSRARPSRCCGGSRRSTSSPAAASWRSRSPASTTRPGRRGRRRCCRRSRARRPAGAAVDGELLALAGAGEEGEAALAARTAAAFIAGGIPPSEVVVFAPSPRRSARRLAAAFAAEGVPFAGGWAASLAESPPVGVVLRRWAWPAGPAIDGRWSGWPAPPTS